MRDPEKRHVEARIGHATSADLSNCTLREALAPDEDGWDDLALWTGAVDLYRWALRMRREHLRQAGPLSWVDLGYGVLVFGRG